MPSSSLVVASLQKITQSLQRKRCVGLLAVGSRALACQRGFAGRTSAASEPASMADSARGAFLLFEGVDKSGKSTQSRGLVEYLSGDQVSTAATSSAVSCSTSSLVMVEEDVGELRATPPSSHLLLCKMPLLQACSAAPQQHSQLSDHGKVLNRLQALLLFAGTAPAARASGVAPLSRSRRSGHWEADLPVPQKGAGAGPCCCPPPVCCQPACRQVCT